MGDDDIDNLLEHLDALAARLTPKKRARDAAIPDCSARELEAIKALGRHGRLTMTALAGLLDVSLSTASRTVERLAEKGLVERRQSSQDRRNVEVRFGPRGRRIDRYVQDSRRRAARAMLDAVPARDRARLLDLLARLLDGTEPRGSAS